MMQRTRVHFAGCMIMALTALMAEARAADYSAWSHMAPVLISAKARTGLAEFLLTPDVYDRARMDLRDIRMAANGNTETGYLIKTLRGKRTTYPLSARLFNEVYEPGRHSMVTAEFPPETGKNSLRILTGGANFRRRIRVEGSDDGQDWSVVRDDGLLFRIGGPDQASVTFDQTEIDIPKNLHRFLRITVFNGPEDPEHVPIESIRAQRVTSTPPRTTEVAVRIEEQEDKDRVSDILLDLGYRHMPLQSVRLDVTEENFFRRVIVWGRNEKTIPAYGGSKDATKRARTVEKSWSRITEGAIYRFSKSQAVDESLAIELGASRYRYVKLTVENQDNPPLQVKGAQVFRFDEKVQFQLRPDKTFTLYVGNPEARRPQYDLNHYVDKLSRQGITAGKLGPLVSNPAHLADKGKTPWSEQHKWMIWVALLAMLAVLGMLLYRVATSTRTVPEGE